MPRGDGTGPMGIGPRTGWGKGNCAVPGAGANMENTNQATMLGLGQRRGFFRRCFGGFGWGSGQRFIAPAAAPLVQNVVKPAPVVKDERADLESKAEVLQNQLDLIKKRLDDLQK